MRLVKVLAATFVLSAATIPAAFAAAAGTTPLTSHRAVYDLELDTAQDRSGITSVKGRIVYEFEGSSCEGYTTRHRIVIQMDTDEFSRMQDQQMSSFEEADGSMFRFVNKTFLDGVEDKVVEGTATRESGKVSVKLKDAAGEAPTIGAALFPTSHTKALLEKAAAGETFFELPIYDGSDEGAAAYTTTAVVGKEIAAAKYDADSDGKPHRAWPVSIAYFDESENKGEGLPVYRIDFVLFEDGITQDLVIDYGDFSMKGKLVDLDLRKGDSACPPK